MENIVEMEGMKMKPPPLRARRTPLVWPGKLGIGLSSCSLTRRKRRLRILRIGFSNKGGGFMKEKL
jgi:hypothetical protein